MKALICALGVTVLVANNDVKHEWMEPTLLTVWLMGLFYYSIWGDK